MPRDVWEARENNGEGVISGWKISSELAGKLESKLDMLARAEVDDSGRVNLPQGMVAGPNVYGQKWIYKLKVNGQLALRPMLCLGPAKKDSEWTILARATERDRDTKEQKEAAATAEWRRKEILAGTRTREIYLQVEAD